MRPLTINTPKPLLKINGKPLLWHLVSAFPKKINEIILVIGYLGDQIKNHCNNEFLGRPVKYVWQKEKKGTYNALELCKNYLSENEPFFVFYADDLIDKKTIKNCLKHSFAVTCDYSKNPERFGVIVKNSDDTIKKIIEKPENPPSNLILASCVLLDKNIFKYPPQAHPNGEYYLSSAISQMSKNHPVKAVKSNFWLPIGTPEDLKKAEKVLQKSNK